MKHIQTITVGAGGAANIEFTSIPQTYTDLYLTFSLRLTGSYTAQQYGVNLSLNGSTSNFSGRQLYASSGTSVASGTTTNNLDTVPGASVTVNTFGNAALYITNYTSSSSAKSFSLDIVSENNSSTNNWLGLVAGLWNPSTQAAITSITLTPQASNLAQYSSASLYGIKNS